MAVRWGGYLMTNRLNILIAGGFDPKDPNALSASVDDVVAFGKALGYQIIDQGHNLLTGCQTDLDKVVAEAAASHPEITDTEEKDELRILSYVLEGKCQSHNVGTIMASSRKDWDIGGLDASAPEVIQNAHAIVLLGGFYGTFKAANWARLTRVPLLPFFSFGGAAREVYKEEVRRFAKAYGDAIEQIEYDQVLKSISKNWNDLAKDTVQLAAKLATTQSVLVCMSFTDKPEYKDLLASIKSVCGEFDFTAERIDESNLSKRIIPQILKQVRHAAFVIVDITEEKPNVYYELGFADGANKEVVLVAKKGTDLPFNVADIPVIYWESFEDFKSDLRKRLSEIAVFHGHV
jgi:predicted Rossmann-fold nucleotide-binding protein